MRRSGFIIIIVIGLLGVLAAIAVQMVSSAKLSVDLSKSDLRTAQNKLLARSGIECGLAEIGSRLTVPPYDFDDLVSGGIMRSFALGTVAKGEDLTTITVRDPGGAININDGLTAGSAALGKSYDPAALEAWEDSNPPSGPIVFNQSGFINLRLRRLLNAYGDALIFTLNPDLGWPEIGIAAPYGTAMTFSSTDAVPKYRPSPGGTGLGDRIVAARSTTGFRSVSDLRNIVDKWGDDVGIDAWLAPNASLFELIRGDFTTTSFEDTEFWSFKSEFGNDADGDGFPDWNSDRSDSEVETLFVETDPPDLSDLWGSRHPVALININAASDLVRAAVFYAPTNVSYLCEGNYWVFANTSWTQGPIHSGRDTIGTGGTVFHADYLFENGVLYTGTNDANVQVNRLMSLRDALLWSRQYRLLAEVGAWPEDFTQFKQHLGSIRALTPPERGLHHQDPLRDHPGGMFPWPSYVDITHTARDLRFREDQSWFTDRYIEETLPNILSTVRRMPGFLGAPLALLSPYVQEMGGNTRSRTNAFIFEPNNNIENAPRGKEVLRSVEDFVHRAPIPKVCFSPPGYFRITSTATSDGIRRRFEETLTANVKFFDRKIWRTQDKFLQAKDGDSQNVVTTPENDGVTPSTRLGGIGPESLTSSLPGSPGYRQEVFFNGNVMPSGSSSMKPANLSGDSYINTGDPLYNNATLQDSELEWTGSIFAPGSTGNDLSPYGGVMLSSRSHGIFAPDFFTDSLYFRPYDLMSSINVPGIEYTGKYFARGVVSCWVRAPSGYQHANTKRTIFHMTLWDNVELWDWSQGAGSDTGLNRQRLRPTFITAYFQGKGRKGDHNEGNSSLATYFSVSDYRTPFGYWWSDVTLQPDVINNNIATVPYPATTADMSAVGTPPQTYALLHPDSMYLKGSKLPLTDWTWFWRDPLDNSIVAAAGFRPGTDFWAAEAVDPYAIRPGGWVKVICKWDLNNYALDRNQISALLAQGGAGMSVSDPFAAGGVKASFAYPPSEKWYGNENSFNSRMILSLGEVVQYRTGQEDIQIVPGTAQNQEVHDHFMMHENRALPVHRLNSIIDDFMMWTEYGTGFDNISAESHFEGSAPGYANRYNLTQETHNATTEPRWTMNPGLPTGSRLLAVRARIYDVPYEPEWGEPVDIAWPRIDVEAEQSSTTLTSIRQVTCQIDGKIRTSPSATYYAGDQVDSALRLKFMWKPETPWGDPINHPRHVFDAPWIEDVQVDYMSSSPKVQSWVVN